jgi:hypothetical protein
MNQGLKKTGGAVVDFFMELFEKAMDKQDSRVDNQGRLFYCPHTTQRFTCPRDSRKKEKMEV